MWCVPTYIIGNTKEGYQRCRRKEKTAEIVSETTQETATATEDTPIVITVPAVSEVHPVSDNDQQHAIESLFEQDVEFEIPDDLGNNWMNDVQFALI